MHEYACDKDACDKEATLREFMNLPAGTPSHDTLYRVFRVGAVPKPVGQDIVTLLAGRHLLIDGRQLRSTTPASQRRAPVQRVSVCLLSHPVARQQRDKGPGRAAQRQLWVSQQWGLVEAGADRAGLQTLVCQQATRWVAGQAQQATRYFVCSLAGASAATLVGYIRGHWGIEEQQHWHLDVTFAEDASHWRRDQAPRNPSTMRKLA